MSELGDLLELLHDAGVRCRTVRAAGQTWHDADRARAAAARAPDGAGDGPPSSPGASNPEAPAERVTIWRLLLERPDKGRLERDRPGRNFDSPLAIVVDDGKARTVLRPGDQPVVAADPRQAVATAPAPIGSPLLEPSVLLGAFRFEVTGRHSAAGRPAIAAKAARTTQVPLHHTGLPPGVDELELLVDAEFGVLLRMVCASRGEVFEVQQIREIAFDEPIPLGSFDVDLARFPSVRERAAEPDAADPPPAPEVVAEPAPAQAPEPVAAAAVPEPAPAPAPEAVADAEAATEPVSLEEAVRRAGFPLLLPRKVPDGPKLRILLNASAASPRVQLHYQFEAPTHHLRLDERPAASVPSGPVPSSGVTPAGLPFERRLHRGQELEVWEGQDGTRAVRLERGGVSVRLDTDLDLETLLGVAVSLVPVRVSRSARVARPPAPARGA